MGDEQIVQALAAIALISEVLPFIPGVPNGIAQAVLAGIRAVLTKLGSK